MRANQTARPARPGRSTGPRLAAALLAVVALPACAGENLFQGLATSDQGPRVEITAPTEGAAVPAGDSVQVSADITGNRGISQVKFTGTFTSGGGAALIEQTVTLANPPDTSLSRFMRRSGATTGGVSIIVEATDALGDKGADTVAVTLN
jgi:hypothetical protein